jgi:hypothetical protein
MAKMWQREEENGVASVKWRRKWRRNEKNHQRRISRMVKIARMAAKKSVMKMKMA